MKYICLITNYDNEPSFTCVKQVGGFFGYSLDTASSFKMILFLFYAVLYKVLLTENKICREGSILHCSNHIVKSKKH